MAAYTSFSNILPDPSNPIGPGGQPLTTGNGGLTGPGFASVQIESTNPTQVSVTNSGRTITRSTAGHIFGINITYNPMTRAQFEPVYNFLADKKGRLKPFFVELPHQILSRNAAFGTYAASNNITTSGVAAQGTAHLLTINHSSTQTTSPQPGDMFTISDTNDSLHTKSYRVTRVMTNADYHSGLHSQPTSTQRIIYFNPPLQRSVATGQQLDFSPKIRVVLKSDVQAYTLSTNNLYSFSLNLLEAQA